MKMKKMDPNKVLIGITIIFLCSLVAVLGIGIMYGWDLGTTNQVDYYENEYIPENCVRILDKYNYVENNHEPLDFNFSFLS